MALNPVCRYGSGEDFINKLTSELRLQGKRFKSWKKNKSILDQGKNRYKGPEGKETIAHSLAVRREAFPAEEQGMQRSCDRNSFGIFEKQEARVARDWWRKRVNRYEVRG